MPCHHQAPGGQSGTTQPRRLRFGVCMCAGDIPVHRPELCPSNRSDNLASVGQIVNPAGSMLSARVVLFIAEEKPKEVAIFVENDIEICLSDSRFVVQPD